MSIITLIEKENGQACQMIFRGSLTIEHAREIEDNIIDALRRHTDFEVDLSEVTEVDICGIHLLGVLDTVGANRVRVVATSPALQRAYERLAPRRGAWLRGSKEERALCAA